jgi:hypothetical protein
MPRDQETSIGQDPATSDDPLFREPDDERGDQSLHGHGDPLRDPLDTDEDTADTPIGDGIATGRHADDTGDEPSDTPGEWVAGNKGPGYVAGRDGSIVPGQPGEPAAERTDPEGGSVTSDGSVTGDRDPVTGDPVASGTQATADPDAPATSEDLDAVSTSSASETPGATAATSDLRTTRDPEVAPDSAFTRGSGAPADPNAPTPTTEDAGETSTSATTPSSVTTPDPATPAATTSGATTAPGTTPATPVPGAPGTGSTTGVQAASAALVTHGAELHDDWARIQSSFVDDPRGSVSQAADLVSQVTSSLVNALQEREQTLRGSWDKQGDQGSDTENLRNALRDYRAFFEMLTKV